MSLSGNCFSSRTHSPWAEAHEAPPRKQSIIGEIVYDNRLISQRKQNWNNDLESCVSSSCSFSRASFHDSVDIGGVFRRGLGRLPSWNIMENFLKIEKQLKVTSKRTALKNIESLKNRSNNFRIFMSLRCKIDAYVPPLTDNSTDWFNFHFPPPKVETLTTDSLPKRHEKKCFRKVRRSQRTVSNRAVDWKINGNRVFHPITWKFH